MAVSKLEFPNLEKKTENCKSHGDYMSAKFGGAPWSGCPVCADEKNRADEKMRQAEMLAESKERMIRSSGIPKRFQANGLESYKAKNDGQRAALASCQRYVEGFGQVLKLGQCLVMSGKTGTGKTHLSTAMGAELIRRYGASVRYKTIRGMISEIKDTWERRSEISEKELINRLVSYDLLLLDEVGVQFDTEAEKVLTFDVINGRYENVKPTVIISNYPIENERGPSISKVLGDRVIDRLRENGGKVITFNWESHRAAS